MHRAAAFPEYGIWSPFRLLCGNSTLTCETVFLISFFHLSKMYCSPTQVKYFFEKVKLTNRRYFCYNNINAGVAELADAPDLGSGISDVQVQVLSPAPYRVFITNLRVGCGHSISFCLHFASSCMYEQGLSCSFCYAGKAFGTYSTATPLRVSSR